MSSLKKIAGYPEPAVAWAMEKLSKEERSSLQNALEKLETFLGEKPSKNVGKRSLPSKAELFEQHIVTIIKDGVKKLEALDDKAKLHELNVSFINIRTDFKSMSLGDVSVIQAKIALMENDVQTMGNFLKYYRGILFYAAQNKCDTEPFQKWLHKQNINKATAYRYMGFSSLIMRFPRLLLCDLNFSQILSHKERIISYMNQEANSKLAHQLSEDVEFHVGGTNISLNCMEPEIPHIKGLPFSEVWKALDNYVEADLSCIQNVQTEGAISIEEEDPDINMRTLSVEDDRDTPL